MTPDAPCPCGSGRQAGPDQAEVEFIARFRRGGASAARLHERSRFERVDGRWIYLDGEHR
jgi:SEC-C motif domain protein